MSLEDPQLDDEYFDEDEDMDLDPESVEECPPDPNDIWPSARNDRKDMRAKYPDAIKRGWGEHSVYDHFDRSRGKFNFSEPELVRTRWAEIPMRLSLPQGVRHGASGINCGKLYVLEGLGAHMLLDGVFWHIEKEEDGFDFSRPPAIPGKMEMLAETIRITPGKRRRESLSESDVSKRFFIYANAMDSGVWRGAEFSPSFYKCLVHPHVKDQKAETPFEWAFQRAEVAMAFVVAMGYFNDLPPEAVNKPFAKIAPEAVNSHPPELNRKREFPNTAEAQRYVAVLKCNWKEPVPEAVCFALENAKQIEPEFFQDESVRNLVGKMGTWLDNGLVVDRLSELFQALVAKKMGSPQALKYSLQLVDEIYGKQNPPWYFHENFNFKPIVERANLGVETPEEAAEILMLIGKYAGHDFQYVADLYYTAGTKRKLERFLPREKAIEFAATVCRWFGIGHTGRAKNIINLFAENLEKCSAGDREEVIKLFLEHIKRQKPSSEIQGRLEGTETNVAFHGLDTLFMTFGLTERLKGEEKVFDAVTIGTKHLLLAEKALAAPLAERVLLPPALKKEFREKLCGNSLLLPSPTTEGQKCFPLPPGNQAGLAEYEQNGKSFLHRLLEFYSRLHKEAEMDPDGTATIYFGSLASKMPDPLKPIPGLLELLSRINVMQETELADNFLFANPFNDEYETKRRSIIPRKYIRAMAVAAIVENWLKGNITEERIHAVLDFLNGKDLVVEHVDSLEDYIERKVGNGQSHFEQEDDYRKQYREKPLSEEEKVEMLERDRQFAKERYESDLYCAKSRRIEQRVDGMVSGTFAMRGINALVVRLGVEGTFLERALTEYILHLIMNDDSVVTVSEGGIFDEDDALIAKLTNLFASPSVLQTGDTTGVMGVLDELTAGNGAFNMEEFSRRLREEPSEEMKTRVIYDFFKELETIVILKTILRQLQDEFKYGLEGRRPKGIFAFRDKEEFDDCTLDTFVEKLNKRLSVVDGVLTERFGTEARAGTTKFKYLPEEMLHRAMVDIRHLREATAVISAVREIQDRVRRAVEKKPLLLSARGQTQEEVDSARDLVEGVRNVTRVSLGIMGSVAAVMQSETVQDLVTRRELPEGVRALLPEAHALVVHKKDQRSFGEELTPAKLKERILKQFDASLPELRSWVEQVRTEDIGMLPVGGKIQVLHPIDEESFERVKTLLGLNSTKFKLIHAGKSVILPASITSKEFTLLVFCLQKLGFITDEFPELQVGGPGRLPNRMAGILGSSVLLATELGKEYPKDAFMTNQNELTAARMMAYDAYDVADGLKNDRLPYMAMPNGETLKGRTDMLGRRSLGDVELYRLIHTSLVHKEFGMAFSDIGEWYAEEYEKLLKGFNLDWILDEPWVFNSENEKVRPPEGSQERHYKALSACTSAYFDCADGKNEIVYRVRELLEGLAEKIRERQQEIRRDPEKYKNICQEAKIAVNF